MRPLPSPGVTRVHRYNEPLRRPKRPGLALAGCPLRVTRPHRWGFPCCVKVLCQRACVDYPGSRDGASVWRPSPGFRDVPRAIQKPGVPRSRGGSATAICIFEARKTFTDVQACWLARSPKETTTPRASDDLVASFAVRVATDYNTGSRVGLSPTGLSHLCTAHTRNRKRWTLPAEGIPSEACPALVRNANACGFAFASPPSWFVLNRAERVPRLGLPFASSIPFRRRDKRWEIPQRPQ